jgi:hypothetical protein
MDRSYQVTICHCFHNITFAVDENVGTEVAIRKRKSIPVRNQSRAQSLASFGFSLTGCLITLSPKYILQHLLNDP